MEIKIVVKLPLAIGLLADLAGDHPFTPRKRLTKRAFASVDLDSLWDLIWSVAPGLKLNVANRVGATDVAPAGWLSLTVTLRFKDLSDFTPTRIALQIPALEPLLREREVLASWQGALERMAGLAWNSFRGPCDSTSSRSRLTP
jgi:type VI secretion system protein ImpB